MGMFIPFVSVTRFECADTGTCLTGPPLVVCPCDYFAEVPLTQESWDLTHQPVFQCPTPIGQTSVVADNFEFVPCSAPGFDDCIGVETNVSVIITATADDHLCLFADRQGHPSFGTVIPNLTDAEALVCRQKVIDYGNALQSVATTEGFPFFDNCPE